MTNVSVVVEPWQQEEVIVEVALSIKEIVQTSKNATDRFRSLYEFGKGSPFIKSIVLHRCAVNTISQAMLMNVGKTNDSLVDEFMCMIFLNQIIGGPCAPPFPIELAIFAAKRYLPVVLSSKDENMIMFFILMFSKAPWGLTPEQLTTPGCVGLPLITPADIVCILNDVSFDIGFVPPPACSTDPSTTPGRINLMQEVDLLSLLGDSPPVDSAASAAKYRRPVSISSSEIPEARGFFGSQPVDNTVRDEIRTDNSRLFRDEMRTDNSRLFRDDREVLNERDSRGSRGDAGAEASPVLIPSVSDTGGGGETGEALRGPPDRVGVLAPPNLKDTSVRMTKEELERIVRRVGDLIRRGLVDLPAVKLSELIRLVSNGIRLAFKTTTDEKATKTAMFEKTKDIIYAEVTPKTDRIDALVEKVRKSIFHSDSEDATNKDSLLLSSEDRALVLKISNATNKFLETELTSYPELKTTIRPPVTVSILGGDIPYKYSLNSRLVKGDVSTRKPVRYDPTISKIDIIKRVTRTMQVALKPTLTDEKATILTASTIKLISSIYDREMSKREYEALLKKTSEEDAAAVTGATGATDGEGVTGATDGEGVTGATDGEGVTGAGATRRRAGLKSRFLDFWKKSGTTIPKPPTTKTQPPKPPTTASVQQKEPEPTNEDTEETLPLSESTPSVKNIEDEKKRTSGPFSRTPKNFRRTS